MFVAVFSGFVARLAEGNPARMLTPPNVAFCRREREEYSLCGSNIFLIVPATQAASLRIMNSKPSLDMSVTYSEGSEGGMVGSEKRIENLI